MRLLTAAVLALALAGSAGADTFRVVPNIPGAPVALPSAATPNPVAISYPTAPPAVPQALGYPQLSQQPVRL